jgi:uncharacterized membrane protein
VTTDRHLTDQLARWQEAGLVDAAQAEAILAHERGRTGASERRTPARASVTEAVGYLGAVLVLAAVGLFVGQVWQELTVVGQLALAGLVTATSVGAALALGRSVTEPVQRLVSLLTVAAVAGGAWTASIVALDVVGVRSDPAAVVVSAVAVAFSAAGYAWRQRTLPQLVLLASVLALLATSLTLLPVEPDPFWSALPIAAVGGAWALVATGGYLRPRVPAATAGSLVTVLALLAGSFGDHRTAGLLLATLVAAGLVAAAVVSGGVHHLAVGAVGSFLAVPQLVVELFGDAIGAPATLLLVGLLLVLLAVGLGRARREVLPPGGAP